jgi:hypothetical protein
MDKEMYGVRMTDNYEKFSLMSCNREVKSDKVYKSIKENGDFTMWKPILVTPGFKIIDGQHRFQACKDLGLPIYYIVYDGEHDYDKVMRTLNIWVKTWQLEDWMTFYVKQGVANYVRLAEKMKEKPLGNLSNAIVAFSNGSTNTVAFKAGKLTDDSVWYDRVYDFVNSIEYKNNHYRPFILAVMRYMEKYADQPRKIEKLRKKIGCVPYYHESDQFLQAFENLK